MDLMLIVFFITGLVDTSTGAVKCHDCSSWNPYCREKVDEPFDSAVAAVECEKTSVCFLKKDETGVINRGCADWWMESQVDIDYIGCQTQHVPWLGEMVWCFCKQDYCNGASIEMMANRVYPEKQQTATNQWGDYTDWGDSEGATGGGTATEEENRVDGKDKNDTKDGKGKGKDKKKKSAAGKDTKRKLGKHKTFDDLNPGYLGKGGRKETDAKYQLWFWHADSDRPYWEKEADGEGEAWRAPGWVEKEDGKGWDFPVTGDIHEHTAEGAELEETTDYRSKTVYDTSDPWTEAETFTSTATSTEDTSTSTEAWNWGEGWGHIKPWWLRDDENGTTLKPKMWTPHPTPQPKHQDDGFLGQPTKLEDERVWGGNSLVQSRDDATSGNNDVVVDISKQDFFCWDCYSDSPLCGETVETQKANYLGKTACSITQKCFVRRDNGVIYRGCADGWANSIIDTSYAGCRTQPMWARAVEWCFCTASLCNGDSIASISHKYDAQLEPFKASTGTPVINKHTTANSTTTTTTTMTTTTTTNPETNPGNISTSRTNTPVSVADLKKSAPALAKRGKKPALLEHVLQKRSTLPESEAVEDTTDFHTEMESTDDVSTASGSSTGTSSPTSWLTTDTGSDAVGEGSDADENSFAHPGVNGTNYKALFH